MLYVCAGALSCVLQRAGKPGPKPKRKQEDDQEQEHASTSKRPRAEP